MDLLFKSNSDEKNIKETDTSVKMSKYILPLLVYIPIIIFLIILGSFFGMKIYKFIIAGGGISKLIEKNVYKIFNLKDNISQFIKKTVDTFWPDKNSIIEGEKSYKHIRLDSILVFSGSLFILVMIIIYNYDYVKSLMFSKVSHAMHSANSQLEKNKNNIVRTGALIKVGKSNKIKGVVEKIHGYELADSNNNETTFYLYYYDTLQKKYKEVPIDEQPDGSSVKQIKKYRLFDIKVGDKIYEKLNNEQFNCPTDGVPPTNKRRDQIEERNDVYLTSKENIYDHNVFNVYNTNTPTDFEDKGFKFVNKNGDGNIDNWDAYITVPKNPIENITKWGKYDVKKGVYGLSNDKNHNGFSLSLKGNGADTKNPQNNYIFKDKNGKTYQTELENYGVTKASPSDYEGGFDITYKIRKNFDNGYDVIIYINNNFVMKVKDGGVPLNEIVWCGPPGDNKAFAPGGNTNIRNEEKSKQYYFNHELLCNRGEISREINGKEYCIKSCGDSKYFDVFTKDCQACPNGLEISNTNNSEYPTIKDCKVKQCDDKDKYYNTDTQQCEQVDITVDVVGGEIRKVRDGNEEILRGGGLSTKDEIFSSFPQLRTKVDAVVDDFNKNNKIAEILGELSEKVQNDILNMGGLPIGDNKVVINTSDQPKLLVYQIDIIPKNNKDSIKRTPVQKEESGIFDRIFNSIAPFTWFKIKRNVKNNTPEINSRGTVKRNSTTIGSIALLFGFVIFTSLLVTQYNKEIMAAEPSKLKDVFVERTSYYMYSIIFVGIALGLFTLLLFYAATSEAGSKFLSFLVIGLSAIIFLAALAVIFKDKLESFVKDNVYIKFIYYTIFIIPCLFVDLVNYIYYEFKSSPKSVFVIFGIEIALILSILILPELRNKLYLYISADKNKKKNIDIEIYNLKLQIIKIEKSINKIKDFNPNKDPLKRIDINSDDNIVTISYKKDEKTNLYVEDIQPANTNAFAVVYTFLKQKGDELLEKGKNFNPLEYTPSAPKLNDNTWDYINKQQLYRKNNRAMFDLKTLLYEYGYKNSNECDALDAKKRKICYMILSKMIKHIQLNSRNIIIFTSKIKEIKRKIKKLKEVKSRSSNIYDKGVIALNKPLYFRYRKRLQIKDFNKNQLHDLKHNYSLSSWFYIHSQPPNFSSEYNKDSEILSYNGSPTIYYNGKDNKLVIKTKRLKDHVPENNNTERHYENIAENERKLGEKTDELQKANQKLQKAIKESQSIKNIQIRGETNKNVEDNKKEVENLEKEIIEIKHIILENKKNIEDDKNDIITLYSKSKFKLQKWHNLVVNYIGGTVDIFLDGELVATTDRLVAFKSFNELTIGKHRDGGKGIGGGICNVVYYPSYISKSRIKNNYNYFKDKNPPTI